MSFKLRDLKDLRPEKTFDAEVELIEHGTIQKFQTKVETYAQTADFTLYVMEGKVYPIVKKHDSQILHSKRKHTKQEAIFLPLIAAYVVVSTWMNIELLVNPVLYLSISTTALLIMVFAMGVGWSVDRLEKQVHSIRLKKKYFLWESNFHDAEGNPGVVTKEQIIHKGKRGVHVFMAFAGGFIIAALFINVEISVRDPLIYYSWWAIGAILVIGVLANWKLVPEENPQGTRLMYAPALIKEAEAGKYEIVDGYENMFETPQSNFETLLTINSDVKSDLIKASEILTMQEVEKIQKKIYKNLKNNNFGESTVSAIIITMKDQINKLHSITNYLVHQVKLKDSEIQADKSDLVLAEEFIEAHALKDSTFSEVKGPRTSFFNTTEGKIILIFLILLGFVYGYLWYEDQQTIRGLTP